MHGKDFDIRISSTHRIRFTSNTFAADNRLLIDLLETNGHAQVLVFIDSGVAEAFPDLEEQVNTYLDRMPGFISRGTIVQTGGEVCKRDADTLQAAWDAIEAAGIDRHSYILCIGGGAYLVLRSGAIVDPFVASYETHCANCHGAELEGIATEGPALIGRELDHGDSVAFR